MPSAEINCDACARDRHAKYVNPVQNAAILDQHEGLLDALDRRQQGLRR